MPGSSRKTRERQLAKLAARRAAVRRHQRNRRLVALVVVLVVALAGMGFGLFALTRHGKKPAAAPTPPPTPSATPTPAPSPGSDCGYHAFQENTGKIGAVPIPTFTIDVNKAYTATMRTSEGTITLQLLPKAAPCTVNSFVYLAKRGFFDGLTFHRVVKDFVIQGGDPAGNGSGGPGYQFNDELPIGTLDYTAGTLAMANSGQDTDGSQFFIVVSANGAKQLQKLYTIFGTVTKGMDVVGKIDAVPTKGGTGQDADLPVTPVTIEKVTIKVSKA